MILEFDIFLEDRCEVRVECDGHVTTAIRGKIDGIQRMPSSIIDHVHSFAAVEKRDVYVLVVSSQDENVVIRDIRLNGTSLMGKPSNLSNACRYPLTTNQYDQEETLLLCQHIASGKKLTMDVMVQKFEKEFAARVGAPYAVMVNSGSSANLLACALLTNFLFSKKLSPGDEVLVPAVCWSTSVWPILQVGLRPVFVDVRPETLNIDEDDLVRKITSRTRALMLVHVMGNCANMDRILKIVESHPMLLIEDTCESLGSIYRNQWLGTFGLCGTYSFYYSHHMTTIEGGMVVCHDPAVHDLLLSLRAHGWTRQCSEATQQQYEKQFPAIDSRYMFYNEGYNVRPMDIQGLLGRIQLRKLEAMNETRVRNYNRFRALIETDPLLSTILRFPQEQEHARAAWFGICLFVTEQYVQHVPSLKKTLTEQSVENRPIITGNFARQPFFQLHPDYKDNTNDSLFPKADLVDQSGLYIGLPCDDWTQEDVVGLVSIFSEFFRFGG